MAKFNPLFSGHSLILFTFLLSACGGGSSGDTLSVPGSDASSDASSALDVSDSVPSPSPVSTPIETPSQPVVAEQPSLDSINGGAVITTASAQLPLVDAAGMATWPFAPRASGVELDVMQFVEMPLADTGNPARWNDMEYTDNRLFVSNEKGGKIYEITDRTATLWFDVSAAVQNVTGRELNTDNPFHGGVRGFAFHPEFSRNGKFYVSMMQDRPANPSDFTYLSDAATVDADSVLVEWTANPQTFEVDMTTYRELFRVGIPEYDHPIKQIGFNPFARTGDEDFGLLYIAHGDGSRESSEFSDGESNDALGKILRINPLQSGENDFTVPSTNPFVGDASMADEVFSLGHRNPHHIAFLPDGRILTTESGRDNIDEVNLVEAGANYGWARREGAFVHLESGTLVGGIAALPANDASNDLVYPVIQYGHTGQAGATFVGQGLGGGFMISNGSELEGEFFYVDFVKSGRLFHSSLNSILASQTVGAPQELTMAQTFEASVLFDQDDNAATGSIPITMPELLQSTGSYDGSDRVDIRIGQGPLGEMYLMNKRNNVIYLVRNSYPPGQTIPQAPALSEEATGTTRVTFDITVPVYQSNELQVRLIWGNEIITAMWNRDELWSAAVDLPKNTENRLFVSFNDRNGDLTLARFEQNFRTGTGDSQTFEITVDEFDSESFDDDNDGATNLAEVLLGSDPLATTTPPTFTMIQNEVFQRCDGCHDRTPAGGLDLRVGESFDNLVNQPSNRKDGAVLVIPFDPDNSYLWQKMVGAEGILGSSMNYGGPTFAQQVREWIAAGALNN